MANILYAERRGCPFWEAEPYRKYSDLGNYRIYVEFVDCYGDPVCGDFCLSRKNPDRAEACIMLQVTDKDGDCWGYSRANALHGRVEYTKAGILGAVSKLSGKEYTDIQYGTQFSFYQEAGANFTPSCRIYEWAKRNHLKVTPHLGGSDTVHTDFGNFQYDHYHIEDVGRGNEKVTIYLSEA